MDWSWIPSTGVLVALGAVLLGNMRATRNHQERSFENLRQLVADVKLELRQLNGTVGAHTNLIGNIETRCAERHLALLAADLKAEKERAAREKK